MPCAASSGCGRRRNAPGGRPAPSTRARLGQNGCRQRQVSAAPARSRRPSARVWDRRRRHPSTLRCCPYTLISSLLVFFEHGAREISLLELALLFPAFAVRSRIRARIGPVLAARLKILPRGDSALLEVLHEIP